jgi:hypothetical protein
MCHWRQQHQQHRQGSIGRLSGGLSEVARTGQWQLVPMIAGSCGFVGISGCEHCCGTWLYSVCVHGCPFKSQQQCVCVCHMCEQSLVTSLEGLLIVGYQLSGHPGGC